MKFELFCPVYNEEYMLPFMIKHYQNCVGESNIIFNIYDNGSTDNTVEIASALGCHIGKYETNGEINDRLLIDFKNNIWKNSKADFVIIIDCDEFIKVEPEKLTQCTIVKCIGYDMLGYGEKTPLEITDGIRHEPEDKVCIFSPHNIEEINYEIGAHNCTPIGELKWSKEPTKLFHMKAHSLEYMIGKFNESKQRLSDINIKNNWGSHYNLAKVEIERFHYKRKDRGFNVKINESITFVATAFNESISNMVLIDSLIMQCNPNWKLIVYHNGVNNECKKHIENYKDNRIKYLESLINTNAWGCYNRIDALQNHVDTKYIIQTSIQDYYTQRAVDDILTEMENSNTDICYWDSLHHDQKFNILEVELKVCKIDWGNFCLPLYLAKKISIPQPEAMTADGITIEEGLREGFFNKIQKINKILTIKN